MTDTTTQADAWTRMIDDLWHANPMSRLVPLSPGEVSAVFQSMWQESLRDPAKGWAAYVDFVSQSTQIWTNAAMQFWGVPPPAGKEPTPVVSPEPVTKRESPNCKGQPDHTGFEPEIVDDIYPKNG